MSGSVIFKRFRIFLHPNQRYFRVHTKLGPEKEEMNKLRQEIYGNIVKENLNPNYKPIPALNNQSIRMKRSTIFSKEKERQHRLVGRIEKIQVDYEGLPKNTSFLMNKNVSTPYQCCQHIDDSLTERIAIAEVNGQLWDMHRPLENNSRLKLFHMKTREEDLFQINRIFWRSCSFMLGAVLERVFLDHIYIELHSFPPPDIRSGSFVNDADLKIKNWKPNGEEMRTFSAEMFKLAQEKLPFERLEVSEELALEMFKDNRYKSEQIPEIAKNSPENKVCIYRIGDFVDISRGPLMNHTGILGKCTITLAKQLDQCSPDTLYRLQGVALPNGTWINHFVYGLIEERGRKLNSVRLPGSKTPEQEEINIFEAVAAGGK